MKMKDIFKSIAGGILAFLGFGSCGCDFIQNIERPVCEYGVPHAEFKIIGTVKDADGKPINGIEVRAEQIGDSSLIGDAKSTETGDFVLSGWGWPAKTVKLSFEDVDGPENGGSFKLLEMEKELSQTNSGDGKWDDGLYEGSVDVTLEKE